MTNAIIEKIKSGCKVDYHYIESVKNALCMDFEDLIYACAKESDGEEWEIRKALFKALYWTNADIYFWEECGMYSNFCKTDEEWSELHNIVYSDNE